MMLKYTCISIVCVCECVCVCLRVWRVGEVTGNQHMMITGAYRNCSEIMYIQYLHSLF